MKTQLTANHELKIFRSDKNAGVLRRTSSGCTFTFAPEFLADSTYTGLSYRIPKATPSLVTSGVNLPPFFAGLLPEGLRLKALVRQLKTSEDDLFSLLAATGQHVIGDIHTEIITESPQAVPMSIPKLREIDFYEYFEKTLKISQSHFHQDIFAGVQEKFSAAMISFPLNIAKTDQAYILKLNPKDKPDLVENEFTCMTLAKKCGIETATVKRVYDKNRTAGLLVTRFDRRWNKAKGQFVMLHQEDGCQFLNRYPADKYQLQFNELMQGVAEIATAPAATSLKLLRLYAFSYLIGNGDLHAKNISLFTRPDTHFIDTTPAYDLICTHVYGDTPMALSFDGKNDNLTRKMFVNFGKWFSVPEKATLAMLNQLIKNLVKNSSLIESISQDQKRKRYLLQVHAKRMKQLA